MNTKFLMISSALLMGIAGVLLEFVPHQVLTFFDSQPTGLNPLLLQLTGALYLGFAMMNWMAKNVLIGGIYARPLAMGNFVHFMVGALALLKYGFSASPTATVWILAVIYSLLAILFGIVFFTHPLKTPNTSEK
jgi:hypothetical protein